MLQVPVEILILDKSTRKAATEAINFLNASQNTFGYSVLKEPSIEDPIHERQALTTTEIYTYMDKVRSEIKGYHPHIICVIERYLSGRKLLNIFASLERNEGNITGRGIVTTYQVQGLIEEIPIQAYLIFYFLIKSLRFLVREKMGHSERRFCIYDQKINKKDIFKIMQYGSLCLECNDKVRNLVTTDQMQSVRNVIGIISDLAYAKNPEQFFQREYEKLKPVDLSDSDRYEPQNNIFEKAVALIQQAETEKAFDEISLTIRENYPDKYHETSVLYSRLNKVNREYRSGILANERRDLEINRINHSLLAIIREIDVNS